MISERHRELNANLHARKRWGGGGYRHAPMVRYLLDQYVVKSVLDFGCGLRTLGNNLTGKDKQGEEVRGLIWTDYDPAFPAFSTLPDSADLVVCTHVLEHVEPEFLDETIATIFRIARLAVYIAVPSGPANTVLPDGRNAHLTCQPPGWWLAKFEAYCQVQMREGEGGRKRDETRFICTSRLLSVSGTRGPARSGKRSKSKRTGTRTTTTSRRSSAGTKT
jgi:hypothetical protein